MRYEMNSLMLRVLLGPIVAALQLFGLYVVVHGHYSPGGGFQAGVLLACSMILPALVHGRRAARLGYLSLTQAQAVAVAAAGVLLYTMIGVASMLGQGAMLDYGALPVAVAAAERQSLGILGIELGVTLGVCGAIVAIFQALQESDVAGAGEAAS